MAFQRLQTMQELSPSGDVGVFNHFQKWLMLFNFVNPSAAVHLMISDTQRSYALRESMALSMRIDVTNATLKRQFDEAAARVEKAAANNARKPDAGARAPGNPTPLKKAKGAAKPKVTPSGQIDWTPLEGFCTSTFTGLTCKKLEKGSC